MVRPLHPTILTAAIGLALTTSATVECRAYLFPKHQAQTVLLAPTVQPVQPVVAAQPQPVVSYAPVASTVAAAPVTTLNAPANTMVLTTGSAPATTAAAPTAAPTLIFNGQTWTISGQAPTGKAPGSSCSLSQEDQNDIVERLRDKKADYKGSTRSEMVESLREEAYEMIAQECDKTSDELTKEEKTLAKRLVRLALDEASAPTNTASAPFPVYAAPAPAVYQVAYPAPAVVQPVIPVQLMAPVPAPRPSHPCLHHLFCPCQWCREKRGY